MCRFGQCRQYGPAFPDSPGGRARIAIEEMVSKPDAIEAVCLCLLDDHTDRLIGTCTIILTLVRREDHQPYLHSSPQLCRNTMLRECRHASLTSHVSEESSGQAT